jgi:UDP-N-acetyl-D-glucosamine dehydrogenase
MKVSVIGQGYVGLTVAIGAAKVGHTVMGFDIDEFLVGELNKGRTHVPGITSEDLLTLIKVGNYCCTTDVEDIKNSEIVILAVPTPLNVNREPDLSYLESAAKIVSKNVKCDALIINESTSFPGTLRTFIKPIFDLAESFTFLFAAAPERVDPGNSEWQLENTPRVIGGLTNEATNQAKMFYQTFCRSIKLVSSPEVAEAAKLFENTFRQVNIALVNEFSKISNKLGFSTFETISAASTKPFGFMAFYPGIGVGGHCIPVDPTYLSFAANKVGIDAHFINLANSTNLDMVEYIVKRIQFEIGGSLSGRNIQIAGIAYKADVSDIREAPAIHLINELSKHGANITWFDPLVDIDLPGKQVELLSSIDLGLIVTPHKSINFSNWKESKIKVLDLSSNPNDYGWPKFL